MTDTQSNKQPTFEEIPSEIYRMSSDIRRLVELIQQNQTNSIPLDPDKLLTVQETAKFLSLAVPTIYGLIHREEIPFMKKNKRVYFSKQELLLWIKSGKKNTSEELNEEL